MMGCTLCRVLQKARNFWNQVRRHRQDNFWQGWCRYSLSFLHGCSVHGKKRRLLWVTLKWIVWRSNSSFWYCCYKARLPCVNTLFWIFWVLLPWGRARVFFSDTSCVIDWGLSQMPLDVRWRDDPIIYAWWTKWFYNLKLKWKNKCYLM